MDEIILDLNKEEDRYIFPETLRIRFHYDKEDVLNKTKWDYGIFIDSITKNLNRLSFPVANGCGPGKIEIEVSNLRRIGDK